MELKSPDISVRIRCGVLISYAPVTVIGKPIWLRFKCLWVRVPFGALYAPTWCNLVNVQHSDCWFCRFESYSGYADVSQLAEEIGSNPIHVWVQIPPSVLRDKLIQDVNLSLFFIWLRSSIGIEHVSSKHVVMGSSPFAIIFLLTNWEKCGNIISTSKLVWASIKSLLSPERLINTKVRNRWSVGCKPRWNRGLSDPLFVLKIVRHIRKHLRTISG